MKRSTILSIMASLYTSNEGDIEKGSRERQLTDRSERRISSLHGLADAWRWRRVTLSTVALLGLLVGPLAHPLGAAASSYSCDTSHCYGLVQWEGAVSGASTIIQPSHLTPPDVNPGDGQGFITNEMWVIDENTQYTPGLECNVNGQNGACWVEEGVTVGPLMNGTQSTYCPSDCYYWADVRPSNQSVYNSYYEHDLGVVPDGDFGGAGTTLEITQRGDLTGFNVYFNGSSSGLRSDVSTNNGMIPSRIDHGMELYGKGGGSAPQAQYSFNYWEDPTTYQWNFQGNDGATPPNNAPVSAQWAPNNAPSQADFGGVWTTSCGC